MISNNIVIVQEMVHFMKSKTGRKGVMVLKLDLEKAYDRLRWEFILDTLLDLNLPHIWTDWIHECVSTGSLSLLWNGERTDSFAMTRGVRQGDPISPYLFVLCLERLGHIIDKAVSDGRWKPV